LRLIGLVVALLSFAARGDVPARPPSCQADRECVITAFDGCCGGCGCREGPRAMSAAALKSAQARCAAIDCAQPRCEPVSCAAPERASSFRAVCRGGSCQAEKIVAECRADSDCTVSYPTPACQPGPCGCCPGIAPQAVPVSSQRQPPTAIGQQAPRPPPPEAGKKEVKFGLSPGPGNPPQPVNCSPCPAPRPGEAVCRAGRCVLAPRWVRPPG